MNREDFETFRRTGNDPMVRAKSFIASMPGRMGTLLYGWQVVMDDKPAVNFHVYLKDGLIHRLLWREWGHRNEIVEYDAFHSWDAARLIPTKRAYPESTNLLLASLLREAGVEIPHTTFDDRRYARVCDETFHALTREEIPVAGR